jgi:hypothetical protein
MQHPDFHFVDRTGLSAEPLNLIAPVVIPKEAIEAEVERLASLPAPANGRRVSMVVNPHTGVGSGFTQTPPFRLCAETGRADKPIRHNSAWWLHPGADQTASTAIASATNSTTSEHARLGGV